MFSDIASLFQSPTNPLYRERDALLAEGKEIIDLVSGNVNRHGLLYPQTALERALREGADRAKVYRPDPLGQSAARQAISDYYQEEGISIPADRILITPGTSLSYWYAFKLLADPDDEILSPRPTYPLFDSIAALSGVRLVHYRLRALDRWVIDLDHLESLITGRTKAIILISPHNPTGAVAAEKEIERLGEIAARHHLPIISDEVFSPFLFLRERLPRPVSTAAPLVLTLNGFSKMLALPGMKIGWIALSGEAASVEKARGALETISDTFLPVNEPAQFAAPILLQEGKAFLNEYRAEIGRRRETALRALSGSASLSFIPPEGGFYLTVRINDPEADEEKIALDLLRRFGLLVHPGYFFDLEPAHFTFSFVSEPAALEQSLKKIVAYFNGHSG